MYQKLPALLLFALCIASNKSEAQCPATVAANGSTTVCLNSNQLVLTANSGTAYSWYDGGMNMWYNTNQQTWTPPNAVPGTYNYSVVVWNGNCSDTADISATILPLPQFTLSTGSSQYCQGDTVQLLIAQLNQVNNWIYSWTGPGGWQGTTQNPLVIDAQMGAYYVTIVDQNGCSYMDAVVPNITPAPASPVASSNSPVCYGDMLMFNASNISGVTYQWNGPNAWTSILQNPSMINTTWASGGEYYVRVIDNNTNCASTEDTVFVQIDSCLVWPGDANSDLTADNFDVLDLALAYGQTGPTRAGATINWVGEIMTSWGILQTNGAEMKHADCNGDGTVDIADTLAVYNNYGLVHTKGGHYPQAKTTANPDLYFDLSNVTMQAGTTVSVPIMLGTSALPMNDVYGLAANISVEGITPAATPAITNSTSWIGTTANTINFTKDLTTSELDWTLARIDHMNISGDGQIGTLTFDIPANATGDVELYIENVKMIRADGTVITDYNVVFDTAAVLPVSVGTVATPLQFASVVPNPSQAVAQLQVSLLQDTRLNINVTDVTGKTVWQHSANGKAGIQHIALPADKLSAGIYIIELHNSISAEKQTMKWVKN